MNEAPPENLPSEAYRDDRSLPATQATHGDTAIQTTGHGSIARKIAAPRDLKTIMANIKIMAAHAGEDWYYRWPVKNKDGTTDYVEGPSIKCATAVARMYGNCEVDCAVGESATHHIFKGIFVDLETGFCLTRPYQQRKSQNIGSKMDAARQADIIFQIGTSKATRNVINNALETFTDFAKEEAKKSLIESIGKNMKGSLAKILGLFTEHKIDVKRVEAVYAKSQNEWLAPDIAKMVAEVRAIADGMANAEEVYPPTAAEIAAHIQQTAGVPGGADAAPAGDAAAAPAEPPADWAVLLDDLLQRLDACKAQKDVSQFIGDNEKTLTTISSAAPPDVQQKWTKALTAKMQSFSPKPKEGQLKV